MQELEKSRQEVGRGKQEIEKQQAELQTIRESFGKAQATIRAARSRIQTITLDKEQVGKWPFRSTQYFIYLIYLFPRQ